MLEATRWAESNNLAAAKTEAGVESKLNRLAEGAGMTRKQLDEAFARRSTPVGTYQQLRGQFAGMEEAGVTRFYLQSGFDPDETGAMIDALSA